MSEKMKNAFQESGYRNGNGKMLMRGCAFMTAAFMLLCCGIPIALCGVGGFFMGVNEANAVTENSTETLEITTETVNLEVTNQVGEIRIRGADVDQIEVEITRQAKGLTKSRAQAAIDNIVVEVRREDDRYIIEVQGEDDWNFMDSPSVNLRITVPRDHINITATNNVGAMSVRDVEIANELHLESNTGGIEFSGKLGPNGDHTLTNNVGGISVQVEQDSEFELDARTDVGGLDVKIELDQRSDTRENVGGSVTGIYGSTRNPEATLTIVNNVGAIEISD